MVKDSLSEEVTCKRDVRVKDGPFIRKEGGSLDKAERLLEGESQRRE